MCSAWIIQNLVCFCKKLFRNYNDTLFIVLFLQQILWINLPEVRNTSKVYQIQFSQEALQQNIVVKQKQR